MQDVKNENASVSCDEKPSHSRKRVASGNELNPSSHKRRRVTAHAGSSSSVSVNNTAHLASEYLTQLPSPSSTQAPQQSQEVKHVPTNRYTAAKRKATFLESPRPYKHPRLLSKNLGKPEEGGFLLSRYLQELPASAQDYENFADAENSEDPYKMNPPTSKRPRQSDALMRRLSSSGRSTDTTLSRDKKYSVYKDVNYPVVLETKRSFMRASKDGLVEEDEELCVRVQSHDQPVPSDPLFDDEHFAQFHSNLHNRSEARIVSDLHSRIMPSVENICIGGRTEFAGFIEGYNDLWVKAIPFLGPRPQPDHTIGFQWRNFSEEQRQKLHIEPTAKSYYTAREEIYFPFFTGEVKCGRQGLDMADRPNAHSMTIHMRGVVDIFRKAGRSMELHRRVLGFSMSHDDKTARLYAHYVEIEGDEPTYYMKPLPEISFGNDKGAKRWVCYQFTLNVCELFALPFLDRLKDVIDTLPDPVQVSADPIPTIDDISVQSSQEDMSGAESHDNGIPKGRQSRMIAELQSVIESLRREIELQRKATVQQRQDARERETDMKVREASLTAQLDQQRKDFEQQRKDLEQQRKTSEARQGKLMNMLEEQGNQIKEQNTQIKELLQKR